MKKTNGVRITMCSIAILGAAALPCVPASAQANPNPIVVDVSADWEHAVTKTRFPARVGNFDRSAMADIGKDQLDLVATYRDEASKSEVTVYLFHAGLVDASIWHDRITAIMASGRLGSLDTASATTTVFTPPSGVENAAIRTVAALSGKNLKSTGVALYPMGDWLISVRISSQDLMVADLDRALVSFVGELQAGAHGLEGIATPKAYTVEACGDALPDKRAKIYAPTMTDSLLSATSSFAAKDAKKDPGSHPQQASIWCRDPSSTQDFGVYRANGSKAAYIIAFGDAGMAGFVAQDKFAGLLGGPQNGYRLQVRTVDKTYIYPPFNRLPAVAQVTASVFQGAPIASATRGAKENVINITPSNDAK